MRKVIFALVLFLTACGGGGGGGDQVADTSGATADTRPVVPLSTGTLHTFRIGDQLIYDATYQGSYLDGSQATAAEGSATIGFAQSALTAEGLPPMLAMSTVYDWGDQTEVIVDYVAQDEQGALRSYGNGNLFYNYPNGAIILPSPLSSTFSHGYSYLSSSNQLTGENHQVQMAVTGTEVVSAPAGRFECYRLEWQESTSELMENKSISSTLWINPSVGMVKLEMHQDQTLYLTYQSQLTLALRSR